MIGFLKNIVINYRKDSILFQRKKRIDSMIMANNLKRQYDLHATEYEEKALEILRSGWYILGNEVKNFENEWAKYIGTEYCVGLASGLDALWMSFKVLGIGEGDEVIVSGNAYIACVMGITINGAKPIFVEPDMYDNIDADKIEEVITPKTKAILAVHLYGTACDMTKIMNIAHKYNLKVVEDCAQSHGNHWDGKKVGTFGDIGCFSFYPSKGCGAFGDAGCIVTDDEELADQFRVYRNYGSSTGKCRSAGKYRGRHADGGCHHKNTAGKGCPCPCRCKNRGFHDDPKCQNQGR